MIYTETIRRIRCDRFGRTLKTHAADIVIARETAERNGWFITNKTYKGEWMKERHYCPKCKKILVHAEE